MTPPASPAAPVVPATSVVVDSHAVPLGRLTLSTPLGVRRIVPRPGSAKPASAAFDSAL